MPACYHPCRRQQVDGRDSPLLPRSTRRNAQALSIVRHDAGHQAATSMPSATQLAEDVQASTQAQHQPSAGARPTQCGQQHMHYWYMLMVLPPQLLHRHTTYRALCGPSACLRHRSAAVHASTHPTRNAVIHAVLQRGMCVWVAAPGLHNLIQTAASNSCSLCSCTAAGWPHIADKALAQLYNSQGSSTQPA